MSLLSTTPGNQTDSHSASGCSFIIIYGLNICTEYIRDGKMKDFIVDNDKKNSVQSVDSGDFYYQDNHDNPHTNDLIKLFSSQTYSPTFS